jgi:hypothetical protein
VKAAIASITALTLLLAVVSGAVIAVLHSNSPIPKYHVSKSWRVKVGKSPGCVAAEDFNNDHILDLAVADEEDSAVTILLGDGKGGFTEAKDSPFFAGHDPNDIAVGDFNNDGNLDLAFANHEKKSLTVLLGKGDGSFAPAPHSPFPVNSIPHTHGVAAGDFNGDKRLDLVTDSWGTNQIDIIFGDGNGGFDTPGTLIPVGKHPYQRLRAADLNGDGHDDIVTTNLDANNLSVLLGDGKGKFAEAAASPFPCGDSPFGVAIGDVNGDGKPDLAVINSPASTSDRTGTNGLTILLGDGTGKFSTLAGSPFFAGKIPNQIAIGDVNGDGINDVVISDNGSNEIYVFLMNESGAPIEGTPVTVGTHPKGIAIADLYGDGKLEIIVCNQTDNDVMILAGY